MVTTTLDDRLIEANDDERRALTVIGQLLGGREKRPARLLGPEGEEVEIPSSLFRVLCQAVPLLLRERAVTIVPIHQELTTQEAADLLNVSRPHVIKLLEQGEIPYTKTGTHRRIKFGDLMTYKERRARARRQALDRLTRLSHEMGLYQ